jgi:hypothetical protein
VHFKYEKGFVAMKNKRNILFDLLIFVLAVFMFSSCGSGGGGGSSDTAQTVSGPAGTGSVAIVLTDSFTEEFSKIIVTITKIELLSDSGKYTIFSGSRKFDFLNLRNETTLMVMKDTVPAMWYEKIRVTVNDVQLYDINGDPVPEPVILTGNHKIDLNPRQKFYVATGKMLTIQLDLDAQNSFILNKNKNGYKFDPVIFVKITGNLPPATRLLRIPGIIHDIDAAAGEFTLCFLQDDVNVLQYDPGSCITVSVSRNTSLFDARGDGSPIRFSDLRVRDSVTVIGFFSGRFCAQYNANNNSCKMLDAVVVERGTFIRIKGTVLSPVDMTAIPYTFDLQLDPGQAPFPDGQIKVLLQDTAKIYSVKLGDLVGAAALMPGDPVEIDGIPLDMIPDPLNEPDSMNGVFVLVDLAKKLSGAIMNIDYRNMTFDLSLINACVYVPGSAQIYLINNLDNSSEIIDILGLSNGMEADVYGYDYDTVSGCLNAKTIIAFE